MINQIYNICLLGASGVGKTSLVNRLTKNIFINTSPTVGCIYYPYCVDNIRLDFWDTGGEERYDSISKQYYRNADIILLLFDFTSISSINKMFYYINELNENKHGNYWIIIIGNKTDLIKIEYIISIDTLIRKRLDNTNISNYIYLSVKTNDNINQLNEHIISLCKFTNISKNREVINLSETNTKSNCKC